MNSSAIPQLKPGHGFECKRRSYSIEDFLLVDAHLPAGLHSPVHTHETAYFGLTLDGAFEEDYRHETLRLGPGTLSFDPGGTAHRTRSVGAHIFRIEIPVSALPSRVEERAVLTRPARFSDPNLISIARRLYSEVTESGPGANLIAQGLVIELLGFAVRQYVRRRAGRIPSWLAQVKQALGTEFSRPPALATLASRAGVHPVHLARSFRAHYGSSVGEFVRSRQIDEAQRLLRNSDQPLSAVAQACGFFDQSHFSNVFRRAVGTSPGRYRRDHLLTKRPVFSPIER